MVMVGLVTLVIIRVGSVTSAFFLSSFGDMRTYSAPMLPASSGALPGQSSTTSGLSSPTTCPVTHKHVTRQTVDANRMMIAPVLKDEQHVGLLCAAPSFRQQGSIKPNGPVSSMVHARWRDFALAGLLR